jgi:hypothetical protein
VSPTGQARVITSFVFVAYYVCEAVAVLVVLPKFLSIDKCNFGELLAHNLILTLLQADPLETMSVRFGLLSVAQLIQLF